MSTVSTAVPAMPSHAAAESGIYVQFGCGFCAPDGWLNFDASYTLAFERVPLIGRLYTRNSRRFPSRVRYGNIVTGLPLPAGCASGIYASHVLEHLARQDCIRALRNTYALLRPGGIFRLLVPDLETYARHYLTLLSSRSSEANEYFMTATGLGRGEKSRGLRGVLHLWLNGSAHLWMWDAPAMMSVLKAEGFRDIRICGFGDCEDTMFRKVEDERRFIDAVTIEARR